MPVALPNLFLSQLTVLLYCSANLFVVFFSCRYRILISKTYQKQNVSKTPYYFISETNQHQQSESSFSLMMIRINYRQENGEKGPQNRLYSSFYLWYIIFKLFTEKMVSLLDFNSSSKAIQAFVLLHVKYLALSLSNRNLCPCFKIFGHVFQHLAKHIQSH